MKTHTNYATESATKTHLDSHNHPAKRLGKTNLYCSPAGFGSYRILPNITHHRDALRHALLSGINLIDTSANYTFGGSEQLIGDTLKEHIDTGTLNRDAIVVVTKGGYMQDPKTEESIHSLDPEDLENELEASLERLGLKTIDIYLLHNPETYFESDSDINGYYHMIETACRYLETEVKKGRIQYYGISSNTFPAPATQPNATSLKRILDIIEKNNFAHFAIIEFPMNLFETDAATEHHTEEASLIQLAAEHQIATLVNRPLNAIINDTLYRLIDFPETTPTTPEEVVYYLKRLEKKEAELINSVLDQDGIPEEASYAIKKQFGIGHFLTENWENIPSYEHWKDALEHAVFPHIEVGIGLLTKNGEMPPHCANWLQGYLQIIAVATQHLTAHFKQEKQRSCHHIKDITETLQPAWTADSLTHVALKALYSTYGISCVLVGMREVSYVDDILASFKNIPYSEDHTAAWLDIKEQLPSLCQ
ncbi:MAG: aldo/keto reductase [Candidatus Margulisbacteria bacterium]|nr:aldo/keto reductase [Candidatus Margulisiibacteriota bacterium]